MVSSARQLFGLPRQHDDDLVERGGPALEEAAHRAQRHVRPILVRVAAPLGVDLAKRHRAQPMLAAQVERRAVAPVQRALGGAGVAGLIARAHGVHDVRRGQSVRRRQPRLACAAALEALHLQLQLRAGAAKDLASRARPVAERLVVADDDRVDL